MNHDGGEPADPENTPQDVLGAGTADPTTDPSTDTLPSSSPPPSHDVDEDNSTVAPSSTISAEVVLDPSVAPDDKDPPTVHTSELVQDEMLLDSSDPDSAAGGQGEDGQEWMVDGQDQEMKRVKVYELVGQRWVDQGTAFCFGQFQEDSDHAHLIARSERNYADVILSTPIRSTDVYQRQQETLIVWTEPNGADYALSFQDPEGCSEVWNFIVDVQQHITGSDEQGLISSSPTIGPEPASAQRSQLPPPQLGIIADIERAIKSVSRQVQMKERICEFIMQEEYFKGLIEVLNTAEDLESIENLHALCSLTQTILMLNDHNLYEHILSDDLFPGVVGMLEYDPEFPGHKANYREFLAQMSHFHEPIPIQDVQIQRKIHHTYRLQFLKDVVLARALDDSTFNVLNSCIIFNQIDIISHLQQDGRFLRDVVKLFVDEEMLTGVGPRRNALQAQVAVNGNGPTADHSSPNELPNSNGITSAAAAAAAKRAGQYAFAPPDDLSEDEQRLRRQVIFLLQQLCAMGKNVQLPARMTLFRSLVDRGLLFCVQWALTLSEKDPDARVVMGAAGEVFAALLDHDSQGSRSHVLKQLVAIEKEREAGKRGADKAQTMLELVCGIVARSQDLAVQSQMGDAMKVWMDTPPPGETAAIPASEAAPGGMRTAGRRDDPSTERFVDYFYRECANTLFKPMLDLPEWKNSTDPVLSLTREETNRFTYLCDLLYNFISGHNFRGYFYVASSQILSHVPTLFKARDKHLQHAAFRIFRLILKLNNANLHTQVMKHDVLKPILDLTLRESRRDNLLSCSCHEYFDSMRRDNMKDMIKFCMTHHDAEIRKLAETPLGKERFLLFIQRWEINNEPPPEEESKSEKPQDNRWPGQVRALDAEEEDYFNTEDDDDEYIPPISQQQWVRSLGGGGGRGSSPMPSLKRKRRTGVMASLGPFQPNITPRTPSPSLGQLMAYGEDDDDIGAIDADLLLAGGSSPSQLDADNPVASTSNGPPPPLKRAADDEDEDNMLEALVRGKTQSRPPTPGPPRSGDKRRRSDDDDDDQMLERLTKSKKPDLGAQKGGAAGGGVAARSAKLGDDPPLKKLKLKFGLGSSVLASSSPTTPSPDSKTDAKDGDTG
ncbi:component of IIS longevity pathway SMK-1-domain-containing protein [Mycena metata]|uniref:Component of IIS longevity pathway SMK-1-domain-containing protein n=1 Tax=Mycena metata TaxID=1033252 RepID=A0AAD7ICB2_9AGAR|nr:component of IIS longevity pathway SMK-1-domain-containing protein [Mycena metata]